MLSTIKYKGGLDAIKQTVFLRSVHHSLRLSKFPTGSINIKRSLHNSCKLLEEKNTKGSFAPITDDQSTAHLPKNGVPGKETRRPRFKFYRLMRVIKILSGGVLGFFLLGTIFVVGSEYLEDKAYKADVSESENNSKPSNFTLIKGEGDEPPTALWPNYSKNSDDKVKPKLVILGTGWGSIGVLKNIEKDLYDIAVVSPSNYFLFTPLLPSVTVGTLEPRSLMEPIRKILKRFGPNESHYFQAKAIDVDVEGRRVLLKGSNGSTFYLKYDHLVLGVGSQSIDFGIKGLEHAHFLHSIQDARSIRSKIFELLETAALPTTTQEERKRMLSFVVCGGEKLLFKNSSNDLLGPTGVEFAAELEDFLTTDLSSYFPRIYKDISISIIQSREHILNTYDEKISLYAEKRFRNRKMNLITQARVEEIKENSVLYSVKNGKNIEQREIPFGLVLWSTGVSMGPLVRKISEKIPEQTRKRALTVDQLLRVRGVPDGSIFALGDCASVEIPKLIPRLMDFFSQADKNGDGFLDFDEFSVMVKRITKESPSLAVHMSKLIDLFEKYDYDHSGTLDLQELEALLKDVDSATTSLPATAQVANQQGDFLAKELNKLAKEFYNVSPEIYYNHQGFSQDTLKKAAGYADNNIQQFTYHHLGSLAYIGNSAVAELVAPTPGSVSSPKFILSGFTAMYLWRSIYWSEQVSLRSRLLISMDWTKRVIFGRDLSKF